MSKSNGEYVYSARYVKEIYVQYCRFSDLGLLDHFRADFGIFSDYSGELDSLEKVKSFLETKVREEERDKLRRFMESIDGLRA